MAAGSIATFMDSLVALEQTIDPVNLNVYRWRPPTISTPAVYNWLLASPSDIPATQIVRDIMNFAVRVVVLISDIDEEEASVENYFDLVRNVLDQDLIEPSKSTLRSAAYHCHRSSARTLTDTFNEIPYMCLELVIAAEFRRGFSPT